MLMDPKPSAMALAAIHPLLQRPLTQLKSYVQIQQQKEESPFVGKAFEPLATP